MKKKQRRLGVLVGFLAFLSVVLTFSSFFFYGFTERWCLGLLAPASFSWFLLTGLYVYILNTNKKVIINPRASYHGKPITQSEAVFFAYVYAVCFLAIGIMLAVMFFREICG